MGIKGGNLAIILGAIALGGIVGGVIARRIKMTAMPQLVSFFNATGGAASALVALIEFSNPDNQSSLVTILGLVIGSIAFSGSMIAYGKLNGNIKDIFSNVVKATLCDVATILLNPLLQRVLCLCMCK